MPRGLVSSSSGTSTRGKHTNIEENHFIVKVVYIQQKYFKRGFTRGRKESTVWISERMGIVQMELKHSRERREQESVGAPDPEKVRPIIRKIDEEEVEEEFSKSPPSTEQLRALLARRDHLRSHHVIPDHTDT